MPSPDQSRWLLTLTNLSYLLPATVATYKMTKPNGPRMDKSDGTTLVALSLFITFFSSWSYHSCRGELSISSGTDLHQRSSSSQHLDSCDVCPPNTMTWVNNVPGSTEETTFQVSRFIDHLMAIFILIVVFVQVVPMKEKLRKLIIILSLLWMVLFLSSGNTAFASLPLLIVTFLWIIFWFVIRKQKSESFVNRNNTWGLSVVFTALAFSFFRIWDEPYAIHHSLWHIFGAIGGALLLSQTAGCYEDIDTSKLDLPVWMKGIFMSPKECGK
jgi:hypothetical protein